MQVTVVVLGVLNGKYNCNSGNTKKNFSLQAPLTKDYYFYLIQRTEC